MILLLIFLCVFTVKDVFYLLILSYCAIDEKSTANGKGSNLTTDESFLILE